MHKLLKYVDLHVMIVVKVQVVVVLFVSCNKSTCSFAEAKRILIYISKALHMKMISTLVSWRY